MSEDLPQRISKDTVRKNVRKNVRRYENVRKYQKTICNCGAQRGSEHTQLTIQKCLHWNYTILDWWDYSKVFFEKKMYRNAPRREGDQKKLYCQKICQKQNQTTECQETMSEKMWANMSDEMPENAVTMAAHRSRSQVITGHHRSSQVITGHRLRGCQVRWSISFGRIKSDVFQQRLVLSYFSLFDQRSKDITVVQIQYLEFASDKGCSRIRLRLPSLSQPFENSAG